MQFVRTRLLGLRMYRAGQLPNVQVCAGLLTRFLRGRKESKHSFKIHVKLVHPRGVRSNELFEILAQWNDILKGTSLGDPANGNEPEQSDKQRKPRKSPRSKRASRLGG